MSHKKTDKQLVWESIKRIEAVSLNPSSNFLILAEDIWKEWADEDKLRVRNLLVGNGLVSLYNNIPYAFQLTAAGMTLTESDLTTDGKIKYYRKESFKAYKIGITIAIVSSVLTAILGAILSPRQEQSPPQVIYNQKNELESSRAIPKNQDNIEKKTLPKKSGGKLS